MSSVAVQKEIPGPNGPQWSAEDYLFCLNKTAIYAVTRGLLPLLVMPHLTFLVDFVDAWLKREPDGAKKTVAALFDRWPQWSQRRIEGWVASPRIPNRGLLFLLLIPFALPLVVVVPWEAARAALSSSWDVVRKGVRGVPPLVTAVVVVFVTGDAWRILGTGFTVRSPCSSFSSCWPARSSWSSVTAGKISTPSQRKHPRYWGVSSTSAQRDSVGSSIAGSNPRQC